MGINATSNNTHRVFNTEEGSIALLKLMGGFWAILAFITALLPRSFRDSFYEWFAKKRFVFFGGTDKVQEIPAEGCHKDYHSTPNVCFHFLSVFLS